MPESEPFPASESPRKDRPASFSFMPRTGRQKAILILIGLVAAVYAIAALSSFVLH
ncbi:MAG: hypothetical protein KGH94_01285 [Candidatus Micrarchaeota archaeon]|nr:hypothetical protein [Candidatus Micrarchaeota archaeon]